MTKTFATRQNARRFVSATVMAAVMAVSWSAVAQTQQAPGANPILRDRFTADPAPLAVGDRLYLYVGHDEAKGDQRFTMNEWLAYSTTDMKHWTSHGPIMRPTDFKWASGEAWATQMIRKNGNTIST